MKVLQMERRKNKMKIIMIWRKKKLNPMKGGRNVTVGMIWRQF